MEVVADDYRERQAAALVLAGDIEEFVLVPVAQLGLPETGRPLRQHGGQARYSRIAADDVGRCGACRHPVVDLPGSVRGPPRAVGTQLDSAHSRHVPQEPVTSAGKSERHRDFGIALDEVDDRPLLVQQAVLVLAEPVEALRRVGVERDLTAEEVASAAAVTPLGGRREMGKALAEELLAVGPEETHERRERDEPVLGVVAHLDDEVTVAHPRPVIADLDLRIDGSGLAQGAAGRLCYGRPEGRAHSNAALPPRVDLEHLAALEHREAGPAAGESRQFSSLPGSGRPGPGRARDHGSIRSASNEPPTNDSGLEAAPDPAPHDSWNPRCESTGRMST